MTVLQVGDVIQVDEQDYKYGTGRLVLRITRLGERVRMADGEWLNVEGLTLRPDGTPIEQRPREALVRVAAVKLPPPSEAPR